MIKTVIFDLDDTLAAEDNFIRSGYAHIGRLLEARLSKSAKEISNRLYELYLEDSSYVFNRLFEENHIPFGKEDIMELIKEYREHRPVTFFYDDVLPTIMALKERGINLGIISDGYLVSQKNKAEALRLKDYFDYIIFTDELGREYWKPSDKAFIMMCEHFSTSPKEMLYVGDNPGKDFIIKKSLPIKTARILRQASVYANVDYAEGVHEDITLTSLDDLPSIVTNELG